MLVVFDFDIDANAVTDKICIASQRANICILDYFEIYFLLLLFQIILSRNDGMKYQWEFYYN